MKQAKGKKGHILSQDFKETIKSFVSSYDAQHNRGGRSAAVTKFKVSPNTITNIMLISEVSNTKTPILSSIVKCAQSIQRLTTDLEKSKIEMTKLIRTH